METQIYCEHQIRLGHLTEKVTDPSPDVEESVEYASDEETVREILQRMKEGKEEEF